MVVLKTKKAFLLSSIIFFLLVNASLSAVSSAEESEGSEEMVTPEKSTFFGTVYIEEAPSYNTPSDGDLWPGAWSDDGYLYHANGDGLGWDLDAPWEDIVVSRIVSGHPEDGNLVGERISAGDGVGQVWDDSMAWDGHPMYNRKPTGMVSVDGDLYLAVQDLNREPYNPETDVSPFHARAFNDVPNATIIKSTDKGKTWTWDASEPMFSDYKFTTIWFLDFGQDGADNVPGSDVDNYVYAYGMDNNWRASFSKTVPDPDKIYLARISRDADLQDLENWEWWTGGLNGGPESWSEGGDIDARQPVLHDERRVYEDVLNDDMHPRDMSVLSQGSVTYNQGLDRYIYTSWTEYTFEFYEAPQPWGPWRHFYSKDFGTYFSEWGEHKAGGYATVVPSKYISDDGEEMWVQSNTFMGAAQNYNFSLRKLKVTPYTGASANNDKNNDNLAVIGEDVTPITGSNFHFGNSGIMNDGDKDVSEDSWSGEEKTEDYWGWTWSKNYNLNEVAYTTGQIFHDGGWFEDIQVQVRQNFEWVDVENLQSTPEYPNNATVEGHTTYTFTFDDTWGDGVRIIGTPGGPATFTSIAELEVYYRDGEAETVADIKEAVEYYEEEGHFTNEQAIHSLQRHLTAVMHFENQEATDKVIRHLGGFIDLLDVQLDNEFVTEEAYEHLRRLVDQLIASLQ